MSLNLIQRPNVDSLEEVTAPAVEESSCFPVPSYDLHNHTVYSGHADDDATVLNILSRANNMGLNYIGISEHVMQSEDLGALALLEADVKSFVSMGAHVLFGVEMDIDPMDPNGRWAVPEVQCDYLILSAHGFPQFDLEIPESDRQLPQDVQRRRLALKWMQWYGKAIDRGGFQILGHPLREPMLMGLIDLGDAELMEAATKLFRPAIGRGIAFELNDAFLSGMLLSPQLDPYLELIESLRKLGMKFTRGSDSHGLLKVGACDAIALVAAEAQIAPDDWFDPATIRRSTTERL